MGLEHRRKVTVSEGEVGAMSTEKVSEGGEKGASK